jgi:hypothetical protein
LTDINARATPASMEMSMTGGPPFPNKRRKASSGPSKALAIAPGDNPAQRHTGIRLMGDMPWGTHICLFYETPEDLLDTAVCYFEAGLKSNEFCLWAVSDPISLRRAEEALRHAIRGFDRYRAAGRSNCSQAPSGI